MSHLQGESSDSVGNTSTTKFPDEKKWSGSLGVSCEPSEGSISAPNLSNRRSSNRGWESILDFLLPSKRAVAIAFLLVYLVLKEQSNVSYIKHSFHGKHVAGRVVSFQSTSQYQNFTVDILSVASINRLDLLSAQKRTFASHESVRNFFNVTELDDDDPTCDKELTREEVKRISDFCTDTLYRNDISREMKYIQSKYARWQWLNKKKNPVGWVCAQKRPISGLHKVFNHYRETQEQLPNYFILMDDDSYYNMEIFQQHYQEMESDDLFVAAGCLIQWPMGPKLINFTFPFGGFGTVISKQSLNYLLDPIICTNFGNGSFPFVANHDNSEAICSQIAKNIAGERQYFENGMSLFDLIYKYVITEKYRDVHNWATGFCMHSDWIIGYFFNFYNVSAHVKDPGYNETSTARIEAYKGSVIYDKGRGVCNNQGDCKPGSDICHYSSADWMEKETKRWLKL